jgi:hypothetical protein
MDARAARERRLAEVTGADGVKRTRTERGHARTVVTWFGPVTVRRMAYRAPGAANLHPADAVLNLPARRYTWQVQQSAVMSALAGSYEQAQLSVQAATGVSIGKQQLEQIVTEAARDAPGFYPSRPAPAGTAGTAGTAGLPLVLSADGKGVAMRPEARRRRGAKAPGERVRNFTRCVFDVQPPDGPPRTPEQIMTRAPGEPARGPKAVNRWYTVDITADRAHTISTVSGQAERRDPGHARPWIALVDGDRHQIEVWDLGP